MSILTVYEAQEKATQVESLLQLVARAKEEILVVNWPAREPPQSAELKAARLSYFDALLERAESGIPYTRILQLPLQPATKLSDAYDRMYLAHFREMLAKADAGDARIELRSMPAAFPGTFLIVDGRYLSWEVCELARLPPPPSCRGSRRRRSRSATRRPTRSGRSSRCCWRGRARNSVSAIFPPPTGLPAGGGR